MTDGKGNAIRRFVGAFQEQFQVSPYAETPLVTAAFEAVQQLDMAGERVVSRHESREKMEATGHPPANFQDQLDVLKRFGIVFTVPRFGSSSNNWYMIDGPFIDWLGDVYDQRDPPMPPNVRTEAIAAHLGQGFIDDSEPDPLAAWFRGKFQDGYVVAEVETASITEMAKRNSGWPNSRPDGYLLEAFVQDGGYEERFDEHILHAELTGKFKPEDERNLKEHVEEALAVLLAAMRYEDAPTFDMGAVRREYFSQDATADDPAETADEADPEPSGEAEMTPEAWQKKRTSDSKLEKIDSDVNTESIRASAYYGRWSG